MLSLFASLALSSVVVGPLAPGPATPTTQDHDRRGSPFDGLRWSGEEPEVLVEGTWYRPLAIDGVAVADILEFCGRRWPNRTRKRFGEDLVEAMVLMEQPPGATVTLELERLDDGSSVTLEGVAMSEAKRDAIRDASNSRILRPPAPAAVSREDALRDLDEFRGRLEDQFAYLERKGIDLASELEAIRARLDEHVSVADLTAALHELLMAFGDGHASVRSAHEERVELHPPFLLAEAGGGIVALRPDRTSLVHPDRPFVRAIDGRPVDDWIDALRPTIPAGSPQSVRFRALRALRALDVARDRLGVSRTPVVELSLGTSPANDDVREMALVLVESRPTYGDWPRTASRLLEADEARGVAGGVGYLRLPEMDDDLVPELRRWMDAFRDTGGLVVDVRGNGGGRRGLLLALAGYLVDPDAPPIVGNVAAYRASERFDDDHLGGSRHLYRAEDAHWNDAQRSAIAAFAPNFEPEWPLPEGFSEWHYLLLGPTGHPDEYRYPSPVVVLCDAGCFSATDIFLGALERLPQVSLVGKASSGGSARSQSFRLPKTGIEVRCASMASFRPDGRLYDGRGVEVDVEVDPAPGDLLLGGGDAQLDAALELLAR